MASTSGDATTPSPKAARLMVEMIKLGDQMKRISYEDEEMMERMRKENEERLGRIHRSSEALSARIENIERRRENKSCNSSHGEDEGYEEDEGGMIGIRREEIRRYGGSQRQ